MYVVLVLFDKANITLLRRLKSLLCLFIYYDGEHERNSRNIKLTNCVLMVHSDHLFSYSHKVVRKPSQSYKYVIYRHEN